MNIQSQIKKAMKHSNKLGAGSKARTNLPCNLKFNVVMKEYGKGTLHSGSGQIVTNPKQAIAIGFSEMRRCKKERMRN